MLLLFGLLYAALGTTRALLGLLIVSSLLNGSAAINLPALGGSSIPPVQFILFLLILRLVLPGTGNLSAFVGAFRANVLLVAFALYGVVSAIILPRIFAGAMEVPPLRFRGLRYIYDTVLLSPSPQNVTTAIYLLGTLLTALCVYAICARRSGGGTLLGVGIVVSWVHAIIGILSVVGHGTPVDALFDLVRNGSYAQLDQSFNGFVRMDGISPEASTYAAYAFGWFAFMLECWLRNVRPRSTGPAAAVMLLVLIMSTSGTAYFSLGVYGVILVARTAFNPGGMPFARRFGFVVGGLLGVAGIGLFAIFNPTLSAAFSEIFLRMTVEKGESTSGLQRAFWARKGIEAFFVSYGLGVGAGSFRSSSLFTAILGSVGVLGIATFLGYLYQVLKPFSPRTFGPIADQQEAIGIAAAWGAVVLLIPAAVSAPSMDPGFTFALFAGAAVALRSQSLFPNHTPVEMRLRTLTT